MDTSYERYARLCAGFAAGAICLQWMATDALQPFQLDASRDDLLESEWQRALRYRHDSDRINYLASRIMLRRAVAALCDCAPIDVTLERDENGKPQVRNTGTFSPVHVNLSHTDGLSIIALSRVAPVGIDVEPINRDLPEDFHRFMCSEDEARGLDALPTTSRGPARVVLWTLKEALIKASGQGLRAPMTTICCAGAPGSAPQVRRTGALPGRPEEWSLYQGHLPGGFQWAVAQLAAPAPIWLSRVVWAPGGFV